MTVSLILDTVVLLHEKQIELFSKQRPSKSFVREKMQEFQYDAHLFECSLIQGLTCTVHRCRILKY